MLKPWPAILNDFLIDRTAEIHEALVPRDREYQRLHADFSRTMDQLTAGFDPETYQLFLDYESAATGRVNRSEELVYRQGLIDGLRLGRYIDGIRKE